MMTGKQKSWSTQELALLLKHTNKQVVKLTGRTLVEVEERRLQANAERNCWDVFDPERAK
ncbi:hypothetical protein [Enterobacter sp.]|uniref:hypothetical protein n=1 Tax=Enterobacter sp. TaxID=42895 RepID=UPI00296F32F2|nr:hypothetical protein [Enterobacter sp.]